MRFTKVVDTLAEIQERHDAVIDLEWKLLELQQVADYIFVQPKRSRVSYIINVTTIITMVTTY